MDSTSQNYATNNDAVMLAFLGKVFCPKSLRNLGIFRQSPVGERGRSARVGTAAAIPTSYSEPFGKTLTCIPPRSSPSV
jgi:hypothetical protein